MARQYLAIDSKEILLKEEDSLANSMDSLKQDFPQSSLDKKAVFCSAGLRHCADECNFSAR
jgi:hypothetical protein